MKNASIKVTVELSTPSPSVASVRETAEKEIFAMLLHIVHYTPERQAKELARLRKIYTAKKVNGFLADAIMWTGGAWCAAKSLGLGGVSGKRKKDGNIQIFCRSLLPRIAPDRQASGAEV